MDKIIIASGPVIVEGDKVLLNNHGEDDMWKFCGGRANKNDRSLLQVAKREVKEEMGIDIKIIDNQPFITHATKDGMDVILVHYLAQRIGEINVGPDIKDWKWFDVDKLPDNVAPNIIPVLKHFNFL